MLAIFRCVLFISIISLNLGTARAASLKQAFSEGKYSGQIRIYNNTLALQQAPDKYGTAFGGRLGYETSGEHLGGFSLGLGYYTANDLETNKEDVSARAPFTPTVDVDIMGEAYLKWTGYSTTAIAGRQLVVTPFANPSDAFLIPITFTGYSLINNSVTGLTLNAHYLLSIKSRESQNFINVGEFSTNRFGKPSQNTEGTLITGASYAVEKLKLQLWHYNFADLFNLEWFQAGYDFEFENFQPYVSTHFGLENDEGEKLLGKVDSKLIGVNSGVKTSGFDLSLGYDHVSTGTFYSPYAFFTDAAYTNSMITGIANVGEGHAWKAMLQYDVNEQLWTKISHSWFKFETGTDFSESDFDIRYKFAKESDWDGFSVWFRLAYREGDNPPAGYPDLIEYRTQLQYLF